MFGDRQKNQNNLEGNSPVPIREVSFELSPMS